MGGRRFAAVAGEQRQVSGRAASGAGGRSDVHGSVCQRKGLWIANAAQTHMHLPLFTRSSVQKPRGKVRYVGGRKSVLGGRDVGLKKPTGPRFRTLDRL